VTTPADHPNARWHVVGTATRTLAAAGCGGGLLLLLHVPGGMLVGAICAVAGLSFAGVRVTRDPRAKVVAQLIVGTGIGASITPESLTLLRALALPIVASIAALLAVGLCCGYAIYRRSDLDLATSLTATAPGGMIEMVLVSDAVGGASAIVAGMHLMRILATLGTLPFVLGMLA
jgi:membrane AbrB-like protein